MANANHSRAMRFAPLCRPRGPSLLRVSVLRTAAAIAFNDRVLTHFLAFTAGSLFTFGVALIVAVRS